MYGESGTGKSCRSEIVLNDAVEQGKTAIVFALENVSFNKDERVINHIDLLKDGINLSLLNDGSKEKKSVAKSPVNIPIMPSIDICHPFANGVPFKIANKNSDPKISNPPGKINFAGKKEHTK
jgi:hypothetical protein